MWRWLVVLVAVGFVGCCCPRAGKGKRTPDAGPTKDVSDPSTAATIREKMREGYCVGSKCAYWYETITSIDATKTAGGDVNVHVKTSLHPKNSNQGSARLICTSVRETLPTIHRVSVHTSDGRLIAYTSILGDPRMCDVRDMN